MIEERAFHLAIAGVVSVVCAWMSLSQLRKARIIEDTPTSKIRSAHQGYVELTGFAALPEDDAPLLSQLGKQACLWFRYKIERYERRGKNSSWRTLENRSSERPFLIKDGTGNCFIYPERAEVSTFRKTCWHGSERYPTSMTDSHSLFGRRYRYTEEILCSDDLLYAIGLFQTRHPPSDQQRSNKRMSEILNDWKQDYDRLVERFDRNGDGEIDLEEWDLARQEALRAAERETQKAGPTEPVNTLSYSPSRQQPYIIATSEPESLSKRFRYYSAGLLAVSAIAAAAFVWLMINPSH